MGAELPDLARRWSSQTERGKGISLSAGHLRLLNDLGAGDIIREHAEFADNPRDFPALPPVPACRGCGRPDATIYFIQQGADGPIKIGIAADARKRLWSLQTSTPEQLFIRARLGGSREAEAALHVFYVREHLRGEWFRPSLRLLAFIREVCDGS